MGRWKPQGLFSLGPYETLINAIACIWLAFQAIKIGRPRVILTPTEAQGYQVWTAVIATAILAACGATYVLVSQQQQIEQRTVLGLRVGDRLCWRPAGSIGGRRLSAASAGDAPRTEASLRPCRARPSDANAVVSCMRTLSRNVTTRGHCRVANRLLIIR